MAKQTSRMYGIKVKERVNYYEFGANDGFITLFYLSDVGSGAWQIKAGKHDGTNPKTDVQWWYNGRQYSAGDTIETFNDGDIVTFHILESHVDTTPYVNYMYDIYGNAGENIEYGNKEVFYRILPSPNSQYGCKVYMFENGMIKSTKEFTSEDIVKYKQTYSQFMDNPLYPVYNMLFDWHGANPQSGYPQMSFQAISNSNYIKYNGNTISKNETINTWQAVGFTGFEVKDDTNKYTAQKKTAEALPMIQLCKRIGGAFICQASKDKKSIYSDVYHDHKDVYYNGHYHKAMYLVYDNVGVDNCWKKTVGSLALTYAYPYWFLMTIKAGIEYGGRTYEARKLINSWLPSDSVNMTLKEKESRTKENYKEVNKVVYDVTQTANVDSITVIMQEIDNNRQYTDLDTRTFTSAESPVTFHNIQFKFETTKWTIISKCGYIKFNGKTYPNGRSILSFGQDEDVHIEITDETNKYFVETEITYVVKTPNSDVTALYSVHTSETEKTLKLVKSVGDKEEPWVTVHFYESMYIPVEYDDIAVRFDNVEMKWELYSNSDNLYRDGTNYKKGTLLASWLYNVFVKIGNIVVTHENHDAIEVTKTERSNTNKVSNQDVDEDIAWHNSNSIDFNISYSYTRGVWTLRAVKDCWMDGIHLINGDIIKQWKTGVSVDPFSFLFAYHDDEDHPELITNVVYQVSASVGLNKVTMVSVSSSGHPTESFSDKDISKGSEVTLIFTKQDARSMYGYIWQKEETPPPPVWVYFILALIQVSESWSRNYGSLWYINNINVLDLKVKKDLSYYSWQWYRYKLFDYKESFLNRIFIQDIYFTDVTQILICDNITDNDPNFIEYTLGSNLRIVGILNKSTIICISKYYYTEETFAYHQYTLFEDGTSRSTYDVENDNEEFVYYINRSYASNGGIYFNIFGQSGNLLIQERDNTCQEWRWWLFYPYQNVVERIDRNNLLSNWNQFIQSINWSNIPVNPQPSDIGSKRSRYEIFSVSDNDNNGGETEECKQFFYNNKIYMYCKVISVQYELTGRYEYGRWYYSERYVENSETIYYKLIVYDVITGNDYLYDIDPTSLYLNYPAVGDYGYIGYHSYSYHPNEYYRFFRGYYKWRNLGIYFVARLHGNYNPQSYYTDKYSELNKYGIFKLNEETYDVELVKEMASDSYIMINKWNPSTEEFDGQLKFYYYNGILDEETGWLVPIDPDAYGIFKESPNYAEPAIEQVTHIDVNNIPSSMNNGILIRYATTVSGVSGYYMYIYFDNPYFNASPGNFCMLIYSGNVN